MNTLRLRKWFSQSSWPNGMKNTVASTLNSKPWRITPTCLETTFFLLLAIRDSDEIKPLHLITLLQTLEQDDARRDGKNGGLSSTILRFIHRILKDIFDRAVEWRVIKESPVQAIKRPKVAKTNVDVYCESEVSELLESLHLISLHSFLHKKILLFTKEQDAKPKYYMHYITKN
ncbi:hypothetical protein KB449_19095 [Cohnella sp. F6_2S_P_1]|uniref:Uncharacterized protein n=1 Tax=Cohnella hashimotonis TaxID=2826895 RepID=A0ABT6TJS6_9BACL|nr:hypothetical protein [Cohnella hashimotonis]MDI4647092.1 hypothetical protein [Cohnella hashimotonis]